MRDARDRETIGSLFVTFIAHNEFLVIYVELG